MCRGQPGPISNPVLRIRRLRFFPEPLRVSKSIGWNLQRAYMAGVPNTAGTREYLTCACGIVELSVAESNWRLQPATWLYFAEIRNTPIGILANPLLWRTVFCRWRAGTGTRLRKQIVDFNAHSGRSRGAIVSPRMQSIRAISRSSDFNIPNAVESPEMPDFCPATGRVV
jgi:hypothetical protein